MDSFAFPNTLRSRIRAIIGAILLPKEIKVNIIMHNNWKGVVRIPTENPLKAVRERLMISRSELARRAGVSFLTLCRIEEGKPCRLDTKRRIVEALRVNPWLENEKSSVGDR